MTRDDTLLLERIGRLEATAAAARASGDEIAAEPAFREALELALGLLQAGITSEEPEVQQAILRTAAGLAFHCGETERARQLVTEALGAAAPGPAAEAWREWLDCSRWPDAWLVAAVRCDPPDMPALNALVERTWQRLFARCRLLTLDRDQADDLAQQTWVRVLRGRRELKPGGNIHAYLGTIARNLWRDAFRAKRRAGPLAPDRLASLHEPPPSEARAGIVLADILPDPVHLQSRERSLLMLDVHHALEQLPSHLRDVVVARFVAGESCASIGARHDRTEQTVSGWLRNALAELKRLLHEPNPDRAQREPIEIAAEARATARTP